MSFKYLIAIQMPLLDVFSNPEAVNRGAHQIRVRKPIIIVDDRPVRDIVPVPLQFSKDGVTVVPDKNSRQSAATAQRAGKCFRTDMHGNAETRRSKIKYFGGEMHSWNEAPTITIKAFSQILNEERDPGLVSKIETTNETVSLNSHSGLQRRTVDIRCNQIRPAPNLAAEGNHCSGRWLNRWHPRGSVTIFRGRRDGGVAEKSRRIRRAKSRLFPVCRRLYPMARRR